jgi:hypothetical protein
MLKSKKGCNRNGFARFVSLFVVVMMVMSVIMFSMLSVGAASADDQALSDLSKGVASSLSGNQYDVEGGGTMQGSELFEQDENYSDTYVQTINEKNFNKLTSKAQTELVTDIAEESNSLADNSNNSISDETVQNWWKQLQTKKGAGSKFLNVILENTKPDFVKANQIYAPFSGIVGTIMGVIAVVGMGLLGIVLVADIFYIVIPPVRMMVAEEGGQPGEGRSSRTGKSKLFSDDALYAVKIAEESSDGGGSKKQALGVYLKRRIPMLILLGICLMYLVSGSIYTLVGYILDLVSGFIGF